MSHNRKNEFALASYGGLEHRPDIRQVLRKSDRKIQTTERDNKRVDFIYSQEDQIADLIPSREDSFERLEEEENMQFVSPCIGVEDEIILRELHENLYRALAKLSSNEKSFLLARFHENKSQQDAAEELGISQQAVSRWEKRCGGRAKTTCGRSPAINDGNKVHSGFVHPKAAVARCFAIISSAYNDTPAQPQTQAMGAARRDPRRG